jgi:hypothetical protein
MTTYFCKLSHIISKILKTGHDFANLILVPIHLHFKEEMSEAESVF